MYHIFIHSSGGRHLGCFLAFLINSAALNIGVDVLFRIMFFSGYMPRSGIAGWYDSSMFSFSPLPPSLPPLPSSFFSSSFPPSPSPFFSSSFPHSPSPSPQLLLWHMEVPGLGVKSEIQLPAYATATVSRDWSHICDLHCNLW